MPGMYDEIVYRLKLDQDDAGVRLDDAAITNASMFLERELTKVRTKLFEVQYPELRTISYLPLADDIGPDDDTYVYPILDMAGKARIIGKDDRQLPMVSAGVREETGKVIEVGIAYGYTASELRRAQRLGKPLESTLAKAARRGIASSIDEILRTGKLASTGQVAHGLAGFLNNADVTRNQTLTNWLSVGSPPTGDQIAADVTNLIWAPRLRTKGMVIVDTFLMATELYKVISTKRMSTYSDTTVLKYVQAQFPSVNFGAWDALSGTGDGTIGTSGYHQIVTYQKTAEVLEAVVPIQFEQGMPETQNFKTTIPCRGRCGGVKWHLPTGAEYGFVSNSTT